MSHTGVLEIRGCAPAEWEYTEEREREKERLRGRNSTRQEVCLQGDRVLKGRGDGGQRMKCNVA